MASESHIYWYVVKSAEVYILCETFITSASFVKHSAVLERNRVRSTYLILYIRNLLLKRNYIYYIYFILLILDGDSFYWFINIMDFKPRILAAFMYLYQMFMPGWQN